MSIQTQDNQTTVDPQHTKEINFRRQERALTEKYEAILQQERAEKMRLQQELEARQQAAMVEEEEDDDSEPYVHKNKLKKKLDQFGQQTQKQTQTEIQKAVQKAIQEERRQNWLKQHPDFAQVLSVAEDFGDANPEIAESILEMPEGFERQKLVYQTIKKSGFLNPKSKEPSIQDKIDQNRRSPYYQPSGTGTAAYAQHADFSEQGQKEAHAKMQELKNNLRL